VKQFTNPLSSVDVYGCINPISTFTLLQIHFSRNPYYTHFHLIVINLQISVRVPSKLTIDETNDSETGR